MNPSWTQTRCGSLVIHTGAGNEMLLRQVTAWWAGETGNMELAQSSRFATVHRGGGHYFKRYHHRDWRDVLKHLIRSSRARRALDAGEQMEALGFHAPRAVCMVEEREGPWVRDSGLVTEEVVDAPNLREWLNRPDLGVVGVPAERRKLLAAAGHEIGRWHRAGLHHGDMRIGNILVRREGDAFVFFWLDNERNARLVPLPMRWRVHNLMQVNMERTGVTKADRLRFWRAYASAAGVAARDARRIQRSVIRYTQSRWRDRGWL